MYYFTGHTKVYYGEAGRQCTRNSRHAQKHRQQYGTVHAYDLDRRHPIRMWKTERVGGCCGGIQHRKTSQKRGKHISKQTHTQKESAQTRFSGNCTHSPNTISIVSAAVRVIHVVRVCVCLSTWRCPYGCCINTYDVRMATTI